MGGHLNPGDGGILGGLAREWREELEADFMPDFEFVGLLNDDTVDVGVHHLGSSTSPTRPVDRWGSGRRTS